MPRERAGNQQSSGSRPIPTARCQINGNLGPTPPLDPESSDVEVCPDVDHELDERGIAPLEQPSKGRSHIVELDVELPKPLDLFGAVEMWLSDLGEADEPPSVALVQLVSLMVRLELFLR